MTSIASATAANFTPPKQRILDTISAQVSAGTISSADQTALDAAVQDIDSSLSSTASTSGPPDPSQIKSKVDDLINGEVANGKLTSDQADTLKKVLSAGGHHGHHGHHGAIGAAGGASASPAGASSDGTDTDSSSTSPNAVDLVADFLKQLQADQPKATGYAASGAPGSDNVAHSLLLNFQA